MKVFVTGATGFLGKYVAERLVERGHTLVGLVRKTSRTGHLEELGATLVYGDVTDRESVCRGITGCDWVIHLASVYSWWEPDKRVYRKINVDGTRNVLECALEAGVEKVVHVSTAGIFGKPVDDPFHEDSLPGPVRFAEYLQTKFEADVLAWKLHYRRGLPLVVIYPGIILGPGDPKATGQYISDMVNRRLPARIYLESTLNYVHVRDVAEAIVRAAEKEGNIGQKYLVGKQVLTVDEMNRLIQEVSGVAPPRLRLPNPLVGPTAAVLTFIADRAKRPPPWGMSADQMRGLKHGYRFDGSKVERELGLAYTPVRVAVEEAVASLKR